MIKLAIVFFIVLLILALAFLVTLFCLAFIMLIADIPWVCLCCAGIALATGHIGITIFWLLLYFWMYE